MKFRLVVFVAIFFVSQSSFSAPIGKKPGENSNRTSFLNVQLTPEIPLLPSADRNPGEGAQSGQNLLAMQSANIQPDCPLVIKIGNVTMVKRCPNQ